MQNCIPWKSFAFKILSANHTQQIRSSQTDRNILWAASIALNSTYAHIFLEEREMAMNGLTQVAGGATTECRARDFSSLH